MTEGTLTKTVLVEQVADVADLTTKRAEVIVETVFGSTASRCCCRRSSSP